MMLNWQDVQCELEAKKHNYLIQNMLITQPILSDNHEDLTNGVNSIVTHLARFGMEVHTEKIEPRGESKTEILFCRKTVFYVQQP